MWRTIGMPKRSVGDQVRNLYSPEALMKIGARLHESPKIWSVAALGLQMVSLPRRSGQIRRYLKSSDVRRLRLGAGRHLDDGWLSSDLVPLAREVVYLDAAKPFPIPSASFDFIVCEHMIEHVGLAGARSVLAECRRILRRGGVLRVATPDLSQLLRMMDEASADEDSQYYVAALNSEDPAIPGRDSANPVYTLNRVMHDWGHQFIYDEDTLTTLLVEAGFVGVTRCVPGVSDHAYLMDIDRHHEEVGERFNEIDTMILEAGVS
jgi:predicted SAM-dependent methyltransferase